jgi:hypothetical protein
MAVGALTGVQASTGAVLAVSEGQGTVAAENKPKT